MHIESLSTLYSEEKHLGRKGSQQVSTKNESFLATITKFYQIRNPFRAHIGGDPFTVEVSIVYCGDCDGVYVCCYNWRLYCSCCAKLLFVSRVVAAHVMYCMLLLFWSASLFSLRHPYYPLFPWRTISNNTTYTENPCWLHHPFFCPSSFPPRYSLNISPLHVSLYSTQTLSNDSCFQVLARLNRSRIHHVTYHFGPYLQC